MYGLYFFLRKCNIKKVNDVRAALLIALPLLLLPLLNLLPLLFCDCASNCLVSASVVLITLFWAFIEEALFRGIIPSISAEYLRLSEIQNAATFSILFALFHFAGILNGSDLQYVAVQVFLAFGVGFSLAALTYSCGSIFPGVIIHFLFNFSADLSAGSSLPLFLWCGVSILCTIYGFHIFKLSKKEIYQ